MRTAVIYARVSSIGDRQETTRQVADLRRYAQDNGIETVREFEEHVSGGKRNSERLVLMDCMSFCKENGIDILLLSELSRLGRNTVEVLKALDELHEAKVNVYVHNLNLYTLNEDKTVNPLASIIITVLAEFYKIERANIQYRLNSGREQAKARGVRMGRKIGSVKSKSQKEAEYQSVIKALKKGQSVRNTAKLCDVSASTVQRVKKEFGL